MDHLSIMKEVRSNTALSINKIEEFLKYASSETKSLHINESLHEIISFNKDYSPTLNSINHNIEQIKDKIHTMRNELSGNVNQLTKTSNNSIRHSI